MKFQPDIPQGPNVIQQASAESVMISGVTYTHSVLVPSDTTVQAWPVSTLEEMTAEHIALILPLKPELVILGTGTRLRFAHPSVLQALMAARIGVETMDTPAACRTYNVLAAEGRRVVAALLVQN
jgi:uncharacterized protein